MDFEFHFTLVVDGLNVDNNAHVDAFFSYGIHDATLTRKGDTTLAVFYRTASCAQDALKSAVNDIQTALPGVSVLRVSSPSVYTDPVETYTSVSSTKALPAELVDAFNSKNV